MSDCQHERVRGSEVAAKLWVFVCERCKARTVAGVMMPDYQARMRLRLQEQVTKENKTDE